MALLKDSLPDERDRQIPGKVAPSALTVPESDEQMEVTELPEGGATVTLGPTQPQSTSFLENLAEKLPETELTTIANDLIRKIDNDKEARIKRDQQYEEGLRRTGLGEEAPGGASFTGASKVTHPMLTEACVDFHASAMKELYPPSGPVKTEIIGEKTPEQLKLADRQSRYMNWQMTEQIEEYPDELSVTMTQLPMAGSQYMKFWKDSELGRVTCEFVPIDDMLLPYGVNSFWATHRLTHVMRLSEATFEGRVDSGMYRELPELMTASAETPETTAAGKAAERIEGVDQPMENLDGIRLVYESSTFLKISLDGEKRLPYLVTLDERSKRVLAIYRNWEEQDKRSKKLHWIVSFDFIPWRGAQKMGFAQMLGGLSAAATGSLRALLDSALVQTIPVLAKLKGAKFGAQSKTIDPMSITEIEAGTAVDDIRKVLMAMPFNPPSPVLYALLGWLTEAAKGVVTTAEEKIADASNQMPVGTALALMESGAKVFSTIHAGLHRSQKRALQIIARLNKEGVDEEGQKEKFGQIVATTRDFEQPLGVVPVSDPNIFSEGQRYAQMQLVTGFALGMDPKTGMPTATAQMHDMHAVLRRTYELAKIPNIDEILPPKKEPTELNAAAENSSVMLGNPIMAFPEQNHFAHLETHMRFILDPLLGGGSSAIPVAWPKMLEHIKQHLSFMYGTVMYQLATQALGQDLALMIKDRRNWNQIDAVLAAASRVVHDKLQKILQPLQPLLEKMHQTCEQLKMPMPMDPSQSALMVAKIEDQRKREEKEKDVALKSRELEQKREKDAADIAIKDKDVSAKHGIAEDKLAIEAAREEREGMSEAISHDREDRTLEHQREMDHRGAAREDHGAMREDRSQRHTERMDVEDRRIAEATRADNAGKSAVEAQMAAGGQAHEHMMQEAELARGVQQDQHGQRMAEEELGEQRRQHKANLGEERREHDDTIKQDEKRRRDENARARAELDAKSKDPKGRK